MKGKFALTAGKIGSIGGTIEAIGGRIAAIGGKIEAIGGTIGPVGGPIVADRGRSEKDGCADHLRDLPSGRHRWRNGPAVFWRGAARRARAASLPFPEPPLPFASPFRTAHALDKCRPDNR